MISPIFDNNHLIGNCYRYIKNYNYQNCFNYSNYLSNNQIWAVIYLYINDLSIKRRLQNYYNDEEFYLIKKEVINNIKKENNYDQLKKYFEGKFIW